MIPWCSLIGVIRTKLQGNFSQLAQEFQRTEELSNKMHLTNSERNHFKKGNSTKFEKKERQYVREKPAHHAPHYLCRKEKETKENGSSSQMHI